MLRFQDLFQPTLHFLISAQNPPDFLSKEPSKAQMPVGISLTQDFLDQIDARAEARALGRRPNRLIHHRRQISIFYFVISAFVCPPSSVPRPQFQVSSFRFQLLL